MTLAVLFGVLIGVQVFALGYLVGGIKVRSEWIKFLEESIELIRKSN